VGDELAFRELGQLLVPRRVERAGNPAGNLVDRIRLSAPARRNARVDDDEPAEARRELLRLDCVAAPLAWNELCRLDLLLACAERAAPRLEVDHRALVVAPVTKQPPQALGPAHVPVHDDEDAVSDTGARRSGGEVGRRRQWMASARPRRCREVAVDVEKRRARNVPGEVELAAPRGIGDVPAAVDELVAHGEPAYFAGAPDRIVAAVRLTP